MKRGSSHMEVMLVSKDPELYKLCCQIIGEIGQPQLDDCGYGIEWIPLLKRISIFGILSPVLCQFPRTFPVEKPVSGSQERFIGAEKPGRRIRR